MSNHDSKGCSDCFRVLSDETRIRILKSVQSCAANVTQITTAMQVTQPTVSYHLKMLEELGLITKMRRGREIVYSFNTEYPCKGCGVFSAPIRTTS